MNSKILNRVAHRVCIRSHFGSRSFIPHMNTASRCLVAQIKFDGDSTAL